MPDIIKVDNMSYFCKYWPKCKDSCSFWLWLGQSLFSLHCLLWCYVLASGEEWRWYYTMLQLLMNSAVQSQRLLSLLYCSATEGAGGAQGLGKGQNQESWFKLAKVLYHIVLCKRYRTEESWPGGQTMLKDWLGTGCHVVSNCVVHHIS